MRVVVDKVYRPIEEPARFDSTRLFERVKAIFYKTPSQDKNLDSVIKLKLIKWYYRRVNAIIKLIQNIFYYAVMYLYCLYITPSNNIMPNKLQWINKVKTRIPDKAHNIIYTICTVI